ncbi:DUF4097 family beta strand repeat-containing protein [Arenimonas donghaensis]|uniref:DUF4097 domain-containing protein n=1 Tax=Arenimonas donghaensis DSM 18148 = HO3-R19 TaxID=1121014 RepID=A0A087MI79_9GAMM|nr:DUF4097 family beta strand repeat-containing protein [Arenimonas donghaensis]KFL36582.1 hypothetical protein N788_02950 [Arenimonas donghaensis DSM 18148 = HO3-R19]
MNPRLSFLALSLLLALPVLAATPIDQTRPLAADGSLRIENLKGEVVVRTWDRAQVHVTGSLGEGVEKLEIGPGGDSLAIEVKYPRNGGGWFGGNKSEPSRIEVRMPAGASLVVDVVSAHVDIDGLAGSPRLDVDSVSGDVRLRSSRVGEARFDLVSGDLEGELDSGDISVDTVSGDVRLSGRSGGELGVDSVSGDAELQFDRLRRAVMDSVSGNLSLRTALAPSGRISADTVSGGVQLRLPADTSARLSVETFSGGISSPVGTVKREKYGPGASLEAQLGAGDGELKLVTFSGGVRLYLEDK